MRPPRGLAGRLITEIADRSTRRRRARGGRLRRASICVGNTAFGGRGKTPIVAALAQAALRDGRTPAILTRAHPHRIDSPILLRAVGQAHEPTWSTLLRAGGEDRAAFSWANVLGDEAPWLAARCPGVPVVASADRLRGAAAVPEADLLILDDGAQAVTTDALVLCVDGQRDPPWGRNPEAQREHFAGLAARVTALVSVDGTAPPGAFAVRRETRLLDLTGRVTSTPREAIVLAGVGRPETVIEALTRLGVERVHVRALGDHRSPSRRRLASLPPVAVVTTEKDAIRWAARWGDSRVRIVSARLTGMEAVWGRVRAALGPRASVDEP